MQSSEIYLLTENWVKLVKGYKLPIISFGDALYDMMIVVNDILCLKVAKRDLKSSLNKEKNSFKYMN